MIKIFNVSSFGRNFKCSIHIFPDESSSDSLRPPLLQIAINVARLPRIPLLLPSSDIEQEQQSNSATCYCSISPEETCLFLLANKIDQKIFEFSTKLDDGNENKLLLSSRIIENTFKSSRFAAFLYLSSIEKKKNNNKGGENGMIVTTHNEEVEERKNNFMFIPRCDAAAFGAAFSCYLLVGSNQVDSNNDNGNRNKRNDNKSQDDHAFSLVWTIMMEKEGTEGGDNEIVRKKTRILPPNEHCGYIRLTKAVKKQAWILWIKERQKTENPPELNICSLDEILSKFEFTLEKLC